MGVSTQLLMAVTGGVRLPSRVQPILTFHGFLARGTLRAVVACSTKIGRSNIESAEELGIECDHDR